MAQLNKLKSTTIYGELKVVDISGNNANTVLNRDLSVTGNIKCSNYITSPNLSTPTTSLIPSGFGTFYSDGGLPSFSFNNGTDINSFDFATINNLSAYLTTANAASTYLSITNAASTYLTGTTAALTYQPITLMGNYLTTITAAATYLTQSSAASIYQTISNMSNYITKGGDIPLNNNAKLSFPSSYPSTAVNNNNAGIGFYWNNSNQFGETDLLCYGKTAKGGLTISTAGNTTIPFTIAAFLRDYITFFYAPEHPTNITIGDISATTQYVDDRLSSYLTKSSAASTYQPISDMTNYLTKSFAASTYQTISGMSNYLTTTAASSTYQTISGMSNYLTTSSASSTYQTISGMSNYLTTTTASSTYQTISNMSNYLTTSSASSIYQTISNMSNYIQRGGDIPFNTNIAKLSFLSSFPTTAVNNNNTGIGFYWNWSGGAGETDLICYGQASSGGLSIYGGGNTTNPNSSLICRLWTGFIDFSTTPTFPTSTTVGNIGATTQYVDNRFSSNSTTRKQTWFLSSNSVGNSYTPANRNIGSSYNSNSPKWDNVTTYGGASSSNWYITDGIFTASVSGLYYFQMCFFTTQTTKVGRFLVAKGSCVLGGYQYLSFNQSYLDNVGSFTVSLMYHMNVDDTFFLECQNESPTFYYANGHTTMQIIKM
jgi:hypothetical protein